MDYETLANEIETMETDYRNDAETINNGYINNTRYVDISESMK